VVMEEVEEVEQVLAASSFAPIQLSRSASA
jgi:hypothetical protein